MHLKNSKGDNFVVDVNSEMIYTSENNDKKYFAFSTLSEESKKNFLDFYWKQNEELLFFDIDSAVENEIEVIVYILTYNTKKYLYGIGAYIHDDEWNEYANDLDFLESDMCLKVI